MSLTVVFFFFQAEDGIRDYKVTGVQTCALPIFRARFTFLVKLRVTPAVCCRVLLRVFDHELQVPGRSLTWNERLSTAKGFIVLLRRDVPPGYSADDGAFREGKFPFAIGRDCYVVVENGTAVVEVTFFVGHRDQPPVAVSLGNLSDEYRSGVVSSWSGRSRCQGGNAGHRCNCK